MGKNMVETNEQIAEWKRKVWPIPEMRGKKQIWYQLVKSLVIQIEENTIDDLKSIPELQFPTDQWCWKDYLPFLRGVGFVIIQSKALKLTKDGQNFATKPSKRKLADQI